MRTLSLLIVVFLVIVLVSFPIYASTEVINDADKNNGVVHIAYKASDDTTYRVLITKGDKKLTYPFVANGEKVSFPLQLGNGTYNVGLLKHLGNSRYSYVAQKSVTIELKDANVVFLNTIQNINWNKEEDAIVFGGELLKSLKTSDSKLKKVYGYLVDKMSYDYDKIPHLTPEYVPSIPLTFKDLKGICYDYSSLMAGIQRSQGIPTKLVKGYTKYVDGYHAWNEVFIDGKWYIVDSTVDSTLKGYNVKVTMVKDAKDYTKVYEY